MKKSSTFILKFFLGSGLLSFSISVSGLTVANCGHDKTETQAANRYRPTLPQRFCRRDQAFREANQSAQGRQQAAQEILTQPETFKFWIVVEFIKCRRKNLAVALTLANGTNGHICF